MSNMPPGESPFAERPVVVEFAIHALSKLRKIHSIWTQIASTVQNAGHVEQFRDMWKFTLGDVAVSVNFFVFIVTGNLVSRQQQDALIGIPAPLATPLDDYLHSLVALPSELVRLATNCVRAKLFSAPAVLAAFVSDLSSGFRLLNMKNDSLRKKFDGLKYQVNDLEKITYDIQIHKLQ
jgi:hypothetical protein